MQLFTFVKDNISCSLKVLVKTVVSLAHWIGWSFMTTELTSYSLYKLGKVVAQGLVLAGHLEWLELVETKLEKI